MAQSAASRLLLENPNGMTRNEVITKLGLKKGAWQSIVKHPMFMKHPDSPIKGRGTRWIVDRKLVEKEYELSPEELSKNLTFEQRAGNIRNSRRLHKKKATDDKTTDDKLRDFYESNKPKDKDTNIVDFFTGSPPFKPSTSRRVTLTIDGVNIDMDISGSVSFTIRG